MIKPTPFGRPVPSPIDADDVSGAQVRAYLKAVRKQAEWDEAQRSSRGLGLVLVMMFCMILGGAAGAAVSILIGRS